MKVFFSKFVLCCFVTTIQGESVGHSFVKSSLSHLNITLRITTALSDRSCCIMCSKESLCWAVRYRRSTGKCSLLSVRNATHVVEDSEDVNIYSILDRNGIRCEPGWTGFEGSCYKIVDSKKTWVAAKDDCVSKGAHLVVVSSLAENNFLTDEIRRFHSDQSVLFWTGATDLESEGNWKWESTGESLSFFHWDDRQPDNSFNEDCVGFRADGDHQWNDYPCSFKGQHICEKEP